MSDANTHPVLVLIRGIPGSGKSHLSNALRAHFDHHAVVLDPDATDYGSHEYQTMSDELTQQGVDAKFHPYRFLRSQAYRAIEARHVIVWNQAFMNLDGFNKTVVNLQKYAADHDTTLPLLVVEVTVDDAAARQRIADRVKGGGHDVPPERFDQFVADFSSFRGEYPTVISVDGQAPVEKSVAKVVEYIEQL